MTATRSCDACGQANPEHAKFCVGCGAAFGLRCARCDTTLPQGARFCLECGAPVEPGPARPAPALERSPRDYTPKHLAEQILRSKAALEGERKQVTVLFVDVKSSMELSEQLEAEDWHAILERFFEILTDGVHRFEGTVNQYTGDGIMALFGAPIAHEDHALRACYAALHLQGALKGYADRLRVERGLNFSARMGINSGEVVVGKIGDDLRMDYTAKGHTVGLAQRMEALADAGKALLAGPTIELVEGFFELRDLGETKVRGVEAPVHLAELQGVGRMRTRLDRSRARGLSRFVGRDEEMARLDAALGRSLSGDGQVVGVVAEAGAGKSRICLELAERCRAEGITVRTGEGVPHGRAIPLEPALRFYREIVGITPEDEPSEARQKIAGLVAQLAPHEIDALPLLFDFLRVPDPARPAPDLSPEARQRATFDLLRRLTVARSEREPALFIFEDLHWIDPQTEEVVEGIVEAAAGTRTLFVVNFRPEYRADWMGRTHYQQLALRPLDAQAAGELLADWLGPDPSLEGFAEQVRDRTGGNPFFMEEVVQAAIESGALVGTRGSFRLERPAESVEVPASVQSLLAARIDRLGEAAKRLLQTGAVIGDDFSESILAEVAETPAEELRQPLRQLVQSEFLAEHSLYPEFEYCFKHPLTREVAYGSLLRDRRCALHARTAHVLEARAGDAVDDEAALLAHHFEQAGERLEAARWQRRAALRLGMGRVGEALFHHRKVVELLADEPEAGEVEELLGAARAGMIYSASRSDLPEEEVKGLFEEAFGAGEDSVAHARALVTYGVALVAPGRMVEALALLERAIEMARKLGDRSVLAGALGVGVVVSSFQEPRRSAEWLPELSSMAEEDPSLGAELVGVRPFMLAGYQATRALRSLGRADEVASVLDRLVAVAGDAPPPVEQGFLSSALATADALAGRAESAARHLQRAEATLAGVSNPGAVATHSLTAGFVWDLLGSRDEAARSFERAVELGLDRPMSVGAGLIALGRLAGLRREEGRLAEARALQERGLRHALRLGNRFLEAWARVGLARLRLAEGGAGAAEEATADLGEVARFFGEVGNFDGLAAVAEARADLAEIEGDDAARRAALVEAARLHRTCGDMVLAERAEARLGKAP